MIGRLPFNDTCVMIPLTVRFGKYSGTTLVYCTCGWERTYKTEIGAKRGALAHHRLTSRKGTTP